MSFTVTRAQTLGDIRKVVADRLGKSHREAVYVPLYRHVNVSSLLAAKAPPNEKGVRPNIMDHLVLGTVSALNTYRDFNAVFDEGQHKLIREINVGIAVDTPYGLLVPVIKNADTMDLYGVAEARRALTDKVMARKHTLPDLMEGTITITNLGTLGIDFFSPIINPPQVSILAVGRIGDRVALDVSGKPFVEKIMTLAIGFDHRVVDGGAAARFLAVVADYLEGKPKAAQT